MMATDPVLGTNITVSGQNAPAGSLGVTLLSLTGSLPENLYGCPNYINYAGPRFVLAIFVPNDSWSFPLPISSNPVFKGVTLAMQTRLLSLTRLPLDTGVTNAVHLTFGY